MTSFLLSVCCVILLLMHTYMETVCPEAVPAVCHWLALLTVALLQLFKMPVFVLQQPLYFAVSLESPWILMAPLHMLTTKREHLSQHSSSPSML